MSNETTERALLAALESHRGVIVDDDRLNPDEVYLCGEFKLRDVLRALHQSGFVIVPVSTTPDMHEATSRCDCRDLEDTWAKVVALFAPPLQTKDKRNDG